MQEVRLTPTSYIVLGLLEFAGESTPYGLKRLVSTSVGNFWTLHHAQLYTEPERLAKGGYANERRERGGRRRRLYTITDDGRRALDAWRAEPPSSLGELREPALLKLFFGADPAELAAAQLPAHRAKLAEYEALRERMPPGTPRGPRLALESGIGHERAMLAFWEGLAHEGRERATG